MQEGCFILFHNDIKEYDGRLYFNKIISPIAKNSNCIVEIFIIPRKCKKERFSLDKKPEGIRILI